MSIRVLFHEQWPCEKGSYADNYYIKGSTVFFVGSRLWEIRYELQKSHQGQNVLSCHPKILGPEKVEAPYLLGLTWPKDTISKIEIEELWVSKLLGVLVACTDGA